MTDSKKKPTGAELRALRDQRLGGQARPYTAQEASRRESSFLSNLAGAQDDYEWIVATEAWTTLGHDSFAAWWEARVQPVMRALSMKPTRELAGKVIEQVRAEEADLPPAQRRTQTELAELVESSEATVGRMAGSRSVTATSVAGADLENTAAGAPAQVVEPRPADPASEFVNGLVESVRQPREYVRLFLDDLTRSNKFLSFDAERIGRECSDETFAAIEAHAGTVTHFYETVRKARSTLRLVRTDAS